MSVLILQILRYFFRPYKSICRWRALRSADRGVNRYPNLHYPEIYLLEGGYRNFYASHSVGNSPCWGCFVVASVSFAGALSRSVHEDASAGAERGDEEIPMQVSFGVGAARGSRRSPTRPLPSLRDMARMTQRSHGQPISAIILSTDSTTAGLALQ